TAAEVESIDGANLTAQAGKVHHIKSAGHNAQISRADERISEYRNCRRDPDRKNRGAGVTEKTHEPAMLNELIDGADQNGHAREKDHATQHAHGTSSSPAQSK